jgi:hypothetical protein
MFRLRRRLRDFLLGLAGGWAVACQPTPSEMPPLAPRPEPTQPNAAPIPGAPDPIQPTPGPGPVLPAQDAGVSNVPPVPGAFIAERVQASDAGVDGSTRVVFDAAPDAQSPLPPLPDGGVPAVDAGPARKPSR